MNLNIKGKCALVFCASRGIGQGITEALAREGVNLILVSRNRERLHSIKAELETRFNVAVNVISLDITHQEAKTALQDQLKALDIHVDILINIPASPESGSAVETSAEVFEKYFSHMVGFFIDTSRYLGNMMAKNGWGRIITVTSSGVSQPINNLVVSNSLRAAMVNWNKTFSDEISRYGVTVNNAVPGRIQTDRVDEIDRNNAIRNGCSVEEVRASSFNSIPVGRYGTVDEFSSLVTYLCGRSSSYITGTSIRVDGGLIKGTSH
ncbi:SDR family oxidoreductase [Vibrio lentus]